MKIAIESLAVEVGKLLLEHASGNDLGTLISKMLELQQQQTNILLAMSSQVQQLLTADYFAARQHLEYARIAGRAQALVDTDLARARDLFVRAISQMSYSDTKAIVHAHIAICATLLDDVSVARAEVAAALELIDQVVDNVQYWHASWRAAVDTARKLAGECPWWLPGRWNYQRDAERFAVLRDQQEVALSRLTPLRVSILEISKAICGL